MRSVLDKDLVQLDIIRPDYFSGGCQYDQVASSRAYLSKLCRGKPSLKRMSITMPDDILSPRCDAHDRVIIMGME